MSKKRPWSTYPKRLLNELNGTSGLAGVGGFGLSLAGVSVLSGSILGILASGGGILIGAGALVYSATKAIPEKYSSAADLVGTTIDVHALKDINPTVTSFAIVGISQVGKTTVRQRLTHETTPHARTQRETAHIIALQSSPPRHIAILDGGGENSPQQFKIAELADCLIIVVDHNSSDIETVVNDKRLEQHREFLMQVRNQLDYTHVAPKKWIAILMNKSDLWERSDPIERKKFEDFCDEEVKKWRQGNRANTIVARPHSNEKFQNVSALMADAKNLA